MTDITLPVQGMTCDGCVASVEMALKRQLGVTAAKASLADKSVTITFDAAKITADICTGAIQRAGFEVG